MRKALNWFAGLVGYVPADEAAARLEWWQKLGERQADILRQVLEADSAELLFYRRGLRCLREDLEQVLVLPDRQLLVEFFPVEVVGKEGVRWVVDPRGLAKLPGHVTFIFGGMGGLLYSLPKFPV